MNQENVFHIIENSRLGDWEKVDCSVENVYYCKRDINLRLVAKAWGKIEDRRFVKAMLHVGFEGPFLNTAVEMFYSSTILYRTSMVGTKDGKVIVPTLGTDKNGVFTPCSSIDTTICTILDNEQDNYLLIKDKLDQIIRTNGV